MLTERAMLDLCVCRVCATVQYPAREACRSCLSDDLQFQPVSALGSVLAWTLLHLTNERDLRGRGPWPIGTVQLDCGPQLIVFLSRASCHCGTRVRVLTRARQTGATVYVAQRVDADDAIPASVQALLVP